MKIGLISRGRTRSTPVIDSLSLKENIPNKFEIYWEAYKALHKDYSLMKRQNPTEKFIRYKQELHKITNKLFSEKDFICKIWPSMLIYPNSMSTLRTFDDVKNSAIFEITDYLKIDQYDKLYFLDRDLYHSTASWIYSKKTSMYHYRKSSPKKRRPVITLNENDYDIVRFYILEYCLQQQLKTFLLSKKIPFEDITQNNKSFINDTCLSIEESHNDYESLIKDHAKLYTFISEWYQICLENTKDWHFT